MHSRTERPPRLLLGEHALDALEIGIVRVLRVDLLCDRLRAHALAGCESQAEVRELALARREVGGILKRFRELILRHTEVAVEERVHPAREMLGCGGLRRDTLCGATLGCRWYAAITPIVAIRTTTAATHHTAFERFAFTTTVGAATGGFVYVAVGG